MSGAKHAQFNLGGLVMVITIFSPHLAAALEEV
jgi:hypothetical protein